MSGSPVVMGVVLVPIGLLLIAAGADAPRASSTEASVHVPGVEVLVEDEDVWKPVSESIGASKETALNCDITVRYQSTGGTVDFGRSNAKIRGGWYARLLNADGKTYAGPILIHKAPIGWSPIPYSDSPQESLFYWKGEVRQGCDKNRRYRFNIEGKEAWNGSTRFVGVERVLYHPSETGWTRDTNVDLGYLDLCLADGNRCDRPYYPGGNSTPFPRAR